MFLTLLLSQSSLYLILITIKWHFMISENKKQIFFVGAKYLKRIIVHCYIEILRDVFMYN